MTITGSPLPLHLFLRATEKAAIASSHFIGSQNEMAADNAAVNAMRNELNSQQKVGIKVAIGEGERDNAPMLYMNERLGDTTSCEWDIAVDPLEGTTICAQNKPGAMSVLVAARGGQLLNCPDLYMKKLVLGPKFVKIADDLEGFCLDTDPGKIVKLMKDIKGGEPVICILERERHEELIYLLKQAGAKIKLIGDGDIAASISACMDNNDIDSYMGVGGAPEGVIAAAAVLALGGRMLCRMEQTGDPITEDRIDFKKEYTEKEIVNISKTQLDSIELAFIASGVTDGPLVEGVRIKDGSVKVSSLVLTIQPGFTLSKYNISTKYKL